MTFHRKSGASEILERIAGLAPVVEQHRAALDRDRRLPQPVFDALVAADLFRLWVPRGLGGAGLSPLEYMEVVEAASELDGSVGWIIGNGAGMSRAAGYVDADIARGWFGEPSAFMVSSTGAIGRAMPMKGGYRISGRWPFGSGIHNASLAMGLCAVADSEAPTGPEVRCCVFSARDVTIIDNWHVSGLRGTGSCDFSVEDLFVPREHTYDLMWPRPTQPDALYRIPNITVYPFTVAVVPLGIARAAINALVDLAGRKVRAGSSLPLREREIVQSEIGRAEALHGAARAFLAESIGRLTAAAERGEGNLMQERVGLRLACAHAGETAARIVEMMATAGGAATIFESSPLERCARDVHAAIKHVAMGPNNFVVGGRAALGLDLGAQRL